MEGQLVLDSSHHYPLPQDSTSMERVWLKKEQSKSL